MPNPYPTPDYGGALYTMYGREPRDYEKAVLTTIFKDGSASYRRQATTGILIVHFEYANLTDAEQVFHDNHWDSCFGTWLGFDFYDPRTDEHFAQVHYLKYEYNRHAVAWRKSRSVTLIKRRA